MALLEILKFPDPRLRQKSKEIKVVTPELQKLAEDMLETMYHSNGIGLAAPQVGHLVRLLVIDVRPTNAEGEYAPEEMSELEQKIDHPITIFNPEIVKREGTTTYQEGCLSVPTYYETVERAEYIEVKGLDIDGNEVLYKTDGLLAICFQHEIDHLDGKLFIDRLSFVKSSRIKNKIKKQGYPELEEESEVKL